LTDVGKVTLYEGTILAREENRILVQTDHSYADRLRFNPSWQLPPSASIGGDGCLRVWYEDGDPAP
jgi:lysine 2,3-aminomutase